MKFKIRNTGRGFTLIELIIVVAVIAVIAAILVPAVTKVAHDKKAQDRRKAAALATPNHAHPLQGKKQRVLLADLAAFELDVDWNTRFQRAGMDLVPINRLVATGEVLVDRGNEDLEIFIPFPVATEAVRQASVWRRTDEGRERFREVVVSRHGILVHKPGGQAIEIAFDLSIPGKVLWPLPPVRLEQVDIEISTSKPEGILPRVLEDSLPAEATVGKLAWQYPQLATSGSLLLQAPTSAAPMGHSLLLFRLTGLAVLLFGAGFWYLTEQDSPGILHNFRWGHFLLLALTYSQFFVVFAVLAIFGGMSPLLAMAIAAAVSLPLLTFHVAKVVNARFAILRILPFAAMTLLAVVGGVYAGPARVYVILAIGVFCMAYLTITYSQWLARIENCAESSDTSLLEVRQRYVREITETLVAQAAVLDTQTELRLEAEDRKAVSMARTLVEESRTELREVLKSRKHLEMTLEHAVTPGDQMEERIQRLQERIEGAMKTLETMTGVLDRCRSLTV